MSVIASNRFRADDEKTVPFAHTSWTGAREHEHYSVLLYSES